MRCIPCCGKKPNLCTELLSRLTQSALIIFMSGYYLTLLKSNWDENQRIETAFEVVMAYRAFNRLYHDPHMASIEGLVWLFVSPSFTALLPCSFALNRAQILVRKATYYIVSVFTALKNKKQRFKSQKCCFALQFTLFLPYVVFIIGFTSLLDIAMTPFLGFAFFVPGFLKPVRGWKSIKQVSASMGDTRSDGHIYEASLSELNI
jgi:hypothetical protein